MSGQTDVPCCHAHRPAEAGIACDRRRVSVLPQGRSDDPGCVIAPKVANETLRVFGFDSFAIS